MPSMSVDLDALEQTPGNNYIPETSEHVKGKRGCEYVQCKST